jgi:hypothetical protein
MLDCPGEENSGRSTGYLLQRIHQCSMTVGGQRLRDFEGRGGAKHDAANQNCASGIGKAEQRAEDCEGNDMFKAGVGSHLRPRQERCELEIDRVDEADLGQSGVSNGNDRHPGQRRDQPEDGGSASCRHSVLELA